MAERRFAVDTLTADIAAIFRAAGSEAVEASLIATSLVGANLAGHDSHGVIRAPRYVKDLAGGGVVANRHATIVFETDALLVMDGHNGFGQVVGREAMTAAMARAKRNGACVLALRHSAHLGRIGDWAGMAADSGLASFHFVNVTGAGASRVAPFGGSDGRLATNPVAAALPRPEGGHIVLDMATSMVAEGKIAVAANRGKAVPAGWLIDGAGAPTTDALKLYGDPPGALLPFGLYKGYGLSLFCDLFAGALIGSGTIADRHDPPSRIENNMLAVLINPDTFGDRVALNAQVERIIAYIQASPPADPGGAILLPGDPERRTRAERLELGIPIEPATWDQIVAAARSVGLCEADLVSGA